MERARVTRGASTLLLLLLASCDGTRLGPCSTAAECGPDQHCLYDHDRDEGQCVATPGRSIEPPPLRVFADPGHTDLLMVIDDGPGTAPLQARLIASLDALADELMRQHDDLRVAVTSTSVASPICDPGNEASSGRLVDRSCLDRLDDFIGPDGTDAQWLCTDVCTHTSEQLGIDPEHPWLDLLRLPAGIDPADALACVVPQGLSGCEYAAPLDALSTAMFDDDSFFASWRRVDDYPEVLVVSDGVDCSVTDDGAAAFDPAGDRALWSDPEADAPTPAVCWNAGVECEGDPAGFDGCYAEDRALDGSETHGPSVLVPLSDYPDFRFYLRLHAITGTSVEEPRRPAYSAQGDPAWLLEHGIDPGCSDGDLSALPPVRLYEMADETYSACAPDYRSVLEALTWGAPLCLPPCQAEAVEVTYTPVGGEPVSIPECTGSVPDLVVPEGAPACVHTQADFDTCYRTDHVQFHLRVAEGGHTGAFVLTPNPVAPEIELRGCDE